MRLLCWRICRDDGEATDLDTKIFSVVSTRVKSTWAHYIWLKQAAEKNRMWEWCTYTTFLVQSSFVFDQYYQRGDYEPTDFHHIDVRFPAFFQEAMDFYGQDAIVSIYRHRYYSIGYAKRFNF
ncbi:hypothetical protein M7I_2667 [Glarea lozoyensis 74030]|uniref:Uncharacterized protein n=1 Tax=Glarea lozoyensis (strain ATCC 74030 / MF5533) TaxID=1104152 RepID=H0EJE1_GLAL7|nr:hypothetical protein M7I_2667 [Glarea lozoyensis 74030]